MARWSVQQFIRPPQSVLIRSRLQYRGTVVADTEKEAIAAAMKQFEIKRSRDIVVTEVGSNTTTRRRRAVLRRERD